MQRWINSLMLFTVLFVCFLLYLHVPRAWALCTQFILGESQEHCDAPRYPLGDLQKRKRGISIIILLSIIYT